MTITVPAGSVLKFDINAAVIRTLKEAKCTRNCANCGDKYDYQKLEIRDINQFLMLHLVLF